ncbi:MAG: glycosyltransferase family 39 protein [Anaerolineaceae bacterium]|nr:glycosyltransferase family 39 protein [Anaerolineaceae bacterium]
MANSSELLTSLTTRKLSIPTSAMKHESGYAYRILAPSSAYKPSQNLTIFEEGIPLTNISDEGSLNPIFVHGEGIFGRGQIDGDNHRFVWFATSDNSSPFENGREYWFEYIFPVITHKQSLFFLFLFLFIWAATSILWKKLEVLTPRLKKIKTNLDNRLMANKITACLQPHILEILLLISISVVLHLVNLISNSLLVFGDTHTYLLGAVGLVEKGNLTNVYAARGPGLAILFGSVFKIFGENSTIPSHLFLHFLGIGCILMMYLIVWEVTRKKPLAFIGAIMTAFSAELMMYTNFLLSEIPVSFFLMISLYFILRFYNVRKYKYLLFSLLCASFSALIRTEMRLVLFVLILWAAGLLLLEWRKNSKTKLDNRKFLLVLVGSSLIALLPILLWSYRNYVNNGFFGMSNYTSLVFYDGLFLPAYGKYPVADMNSPAVQKIEEALHHHPDSKVSLDELGIGSSPVSLDARLIQSFYDISNEETYEIISQAFFDSISENPFVYVDFLIHKVLSTIGKHEIYSLNVFSTECVEPLEQYIQHCNTQLTTSRWRELLNLIQVIHWDIVNHLNVLKIPFYWRLFSLISLTFIWLRKQTYLWIIIISFTGLVCLMPIVIGLGIFRYLVPGLFLFNLIGLASLDFLSGKLRLYIRSWKNILIND